MYLRMVWHRRCARQPQPLWSPHPCDCLLVGEVGYIKEPVDTSSKLIHIWDWGLCIYEPTWSKPRLPTMKLTGYVMTLHVSELQACESYSVPGHTTRSGILPIFPFLKANNSWQVWPAQGSDHIGNVTMNTLTLTAQWTSSIQMKFVANDTCTCLCITPQAQRFVHHASLAW